MTHFNYNLLSVTPIFSVSALVQLIALMAVTGEHLACQKPAAEMPKVLPLVGTQRDCE